MSWSCQACAHVNAQEGRFCGNCGALRPQSSPPPDPRLGTIILGRYRIVGVIGEGAMGIVYRAEQRMGNAARPVAIKLLHAAYTSDDALRSRFLRECEVVVQLEHPNTIKFYDFGELDDGSLAIVMEFIDGESLADRVERGPLPPDVTMHIVGQICGSLHEAHGRGIVHRDLKPENILLTSRAGQRDIVKVCDFGIAKQAGLDVAKPQLTMQGTVIGTPPYMSPEQVSSGDLDARSDIYSLGVLTYEMLTGTYPWTDARTVYEWAQRHLNVPPTPIEAHPIAASLSQSARAAIMRALSKPRELRQPSVLEFARELIARDRMEVDWGLRTVRPPPPARSVAETEQMASAAGLSAYVPATSDYRAISAPPPPRKRGTKGMALLLVGSLALGALTTLGLFFVFFYDHGGASVHPSPPVAPPIAVDAGSAPPADDGAPEDWMRIVSAQRLAADASAAVGAPDHRSASIPRGGTITLALIGESAIGTDGAEGPDLFVDVAEGSGPYRVEVGDDDELRTIVSDAEGQQPLDLDQYGISHTRYVRITARGSRAVLLDAVGVYHVAH